MMGLIMPVARSRGLTRAMDPCIMVIFGASGDLTRRKLIPSLFALARKRLLPSNFFIVGFALDNWSDQQFRDELRGEIDARAWQDFAAHMFYVPGDFQDPASYKRLCQVLSELDERTQTPDNHLYYLATPPAFYQDIIQNLANCRLTRSEQGVWRRVIIEKPFGHDLVSERQLNVAISKVLDESQVYRIDHYLGKETVQNLLVFRFANRIFEPLWNRDYIDHIQITTAETLGVEQRGAYYDNANVVRDMFQNHMLQLLGLIAMEPPVAFEADAVRDETAKLLRALQPLPHKKLERYAVRGQYAAGTVNEMAVPAYRDEARVAPDSLTPTFAALKVYLHNWRWEGVPFYLHSGKRMASKRSEIVVQFKRTPHLMFRRMLKSQPEPNLLVFRLQPDEGISLQFDVKQPTELLSMRSVQMHFDYDRAFGEPPEAYQGLLLDCMQGDQTLFVRSDWLELSWSYITPLLEAWEAKPPSDFPNYAAGSWGPATADTLLGQRRWYNQ
jgi:glucose-6-phosphate 1-dehydrogenase